MKDMIGKYLLRLRIREVIPHITGRLLDIGCGTNDLVKTYPGSGVGVDVYDWGGVDLVVENTAHLPYKSQEFDTVTIIAALNHIPNRDQVLKEAYRVLTANGKIILTMIPPFISTIWHTVRRPWDVDQKDRGMKQGEVYGLSHEQIHSLLREAGFNVTYETRFMLGINLLVVADKVVAS